MGWGPCDAPPPAMPAFLTSIETRRRSRHRGPKDLFEQNRGLPGPEKGTVSRRAWFLATGLGRPVFTPRDIVNCYQAIDLIPPPLLEQAGELALENKLIRVPAGHYRLEMRTKEALDAKFAGPRERPVRVEVIKLLSDLPSRVPSLTERGYLEEALICFEHNAVRAAVVMAWNLAYDHLCFYVFNDKDRLERFNKQLTKTYPKASIPKIANGDDFSELKESEVLQVCDSAAIITADLHRIMKEKLGKEQCRSSLRGNHPRTHGGRAHP